MVTAPLSKRPPALGRRRPQRRQDARSIQLPSAPSSAWQSGCGQCHSPTRRSAGAVRHFAAQVRAARACRSESSRRILASCCGSKGRPCALARRRRPMSASKARRRRSSHGICSARGAVGARMTSDSGSRRTVSTVALPSPRLRVTVRRAASWTSCVPAGRCHMWSPMPSETSKQWRECQMRIRRSCRSLLPLSRIRTSRPLGAIAQWPGSPGRGGPPPRCPVGRTCGSRPRGLRRARRPRAGVTDAPRSMRKGSTTVILPASGR